MSFTLLRALTMWALVATVLLSIPHVDAATLKQAQMKDLRERATPVQARSPQTSPQMRARAPAPQVSQMRARAPAPQVSQMRARAPAPQVSQMRARAPAPQVSQMRARAPAPQASQMRRDMTVLDDSPDRRCARDWQSCPIFVESKIKGYECVDVQHDLESCGGCVVNGEALGDGGRDCSAISHADGVSCMKGRCIIDQCASGYVKSADGQDCVPSQPSV
ncbi:hypothetical protein PUNSTDRAFT_122189 [Punctularia strigosozonata HHB-11173 SS5]|uniref:uncharacterized protein n=1 Tax=Punctularia strigosozonata (strain HHB-11173) TaxID=741275 RepID=UPI000441860F|nr:uncharacterized protein PUNSTDRAFT_122189 [Punctularia strigosozonata HHB-11173 SS5]EIN05729.1 hypothetical protein PUNSTDRAFT_122189 [Punctularia strigosozonata HHB-11173 SS5]